MPTYRPNAKTIVTYNSDKWIEVSNAKKVFNVQEELDHPLKGKEIVGPRGERYKVVKVFEEFFFGRFIKLLVVENASRTVLFWEALTEVPDAISEQIKLVRKLYKEVV
jgi:hypothetical protein